MTSKYPAIIDSSLELPTAANLITPITASVINNIREAIINVELALGTNPGSTFNTVKNRLDAIQGVIDDLIISGGASSIPIGPAGGHLTGFYPNPLVISFSLSGETNNKIAYFDGSEWKASFITNANVDAAAAIAGTKISPDFGSQNITTTGSISATFSSAGEVANIAALKAFSNTPPIPSNTKIFVKGYYSVGDGGGGDFYWDSTSTDTDNGGTIIELDVMGTGRWIRIFDGPINVKWFGAKGDGITNDLGAINAAVSTNGGTIYFPTGIYLINGVIAVGANNISFIGDGRASIIRASASSFNMVQLSNADYFRSEGMAYEGAATDGYTTQTAIVAVVNTAKVKILNCYFGGQNDSIGINNAIVCATNSNDWQIIGNNVERLFGNDSILGAGYAFLLAVCNNAIITHNRIVGNPLGGRHAVYISSGSSYWIFSENEIDNFLDDAVVIFSQGAEDFGIENKITNNKITNTTLSAIHIADRVSDTLISGNFISDSGFYGIWVELLDDNGNTVINDNEILRSGKEGIIITDSKRVSVINNTIVDSSLSDAATYPAVEVVRGDRISINYNTIVATNPASPMHRHAVRFNSGNTPTNSEIIGNVYDDSHTFAAPPNISYDRIAPISTVRDNRSRTARTYVAADTSPTVEGIDSLIIANLISTTITNLDFYDDKQIVVLKFSDGYTTIQHNSNIKLENGLDFISINNSTLTLQNIGGTWYEIARARNSSLFSSILNVKDFGAIGDGYADDTDAINNAIIAAYNAGGGIVLLGAGTYKCTSEISLLDKVSLEGLGPENTTITFAGAAGGIGPFPNNACIYAAGSLIEIQTLLLDGYTNDQSITLTSVPSLSAYDIIIIYNSTDSSFSTARSYYRAGEFAKVLSIGGSTVNLFDKLYGSYTVGSNIHIYKLTPVKVSIKGLNIIGQGTGGDYNILLDMTNNASISYINCSNTNGANIGIQRSFEILLDHIKAEDISAPVGANYGIGIINSQKIIITNCILFTSRHGITHGGGDFTAGVPCRDSLISNCIVGNNGLGQVNGIDWHGNSENIILDNCFLPNGVNGGGDRYKITNCTIFPGTNNGEAIHASELLGLDILIQGNTIYANKEINNNYGLINIGYPDQSHLTRTRGVLKISDNKIKQNTFVGKTIYIYSLDIPTADLDIDISNNNINCESTSGSSFVNIRATDGYGFKNVVISNNIFRGVGLFINGINAETINIKNNTITDGYYFGIGIATAATTTISKQFISIQGNYIERSNLTGILAEGQSQLFSILEIKDNFVINCAQVPEGDPSLDSSVFIYNAKTAIFQDNTIGDNQLIPTQTSAWAALDITTLVEDNNTNIGSVSAAAMSGVTKELKRYTDRGQLKDAFGTSAPVSGAWTTGDRVWNRTPTNEGNAGWICTSSGTPGTWRTFAMISSGTQVINVKDYGAIGDGIADDTDAINNAITASYNAGGGTVLLGAGTYKCASQIYLLDKVSLEGLGPENTTITFAGALAGSFPNAACIYAIGSLTEIQTLLLDGYTDDQSITLTAAPSLSANDIIIIYNSDDFSFSTARDVYRAGEFARVLSVSSNIVNLFEKIYGSYSPGSNIHIYKLNSVNVSVKDVNIIGQGSNQLSIIKFDLTSNSSVKNIHATGTNYSHINITRSFGILLDHIKVEDFSTPVGLNYGITISNSQKIITTNCILFTSRHGLAHGGGDYVAAVPVRDSIISNCIIGNNGTGLVVGLDWHGNAENITVDNCLLPQGMEFGGDRAKITNCTIFSGTNAGEAIHASELLGYDILIDGNTIYANMDINSSYGLVNIGYPGQAYLTRTRGLLKISNNKIKQGIYGGINIYVYSLADAPTTDLDIEISNNSINCEDAITASFMDIRAVDGYGFKNVVVSDNTLRGTGIYLDSLNAETVHIKNNTITDSTYFGIGINNTTTTIISKQFISINGNYVEKAKYTGILVYGQSQSFSVLDVKNNFSVNCAQTSLSNPYIDSSIYVNGAATVVLQNNTIGDNQLVPTQTSLYGATNITTLIDDDNINIGSINLISSLSVINTIKDTITNVKHYGAVGDGTTDDTAAIQAAITASFSVGRMVFFPSGDYRITSQITIPEATTLFGLGHPPGGTAGTGNGYPTILHDFDGYLFVFNGANGSGIASGGGVENLRMVQTFGPVSGTTGRGAAIVFTGSDVDHRINWGKIRNCIIEEGGNDPWTWAIIMDGKDAYADAGLLDLFISEVSTHTANAAGGAFLLNAVAGLVIDNCELYIEGHITITGTPLVSSADVHINNCIVGHLLVDYANTVSLTGGQVVTITTTTNTEDTCVFMPGVLTQTYTDAGPGERSSAAIWYEPNGVFDPGAGRFRISKSILLPNNEVLYGFNAANSAIIPLVSTSGADSIVIGRTGGHNILLGNVPNLNSAGASDVVMPHSVAFRSVNNASNDTYNLIKSGAADDTITIGGTTNSNLTLAASTSSSIFITTGATIPLTLTSSAITIGTGVTLVATGTGNINLPNNASARFNIDGYAVSANVIAANLNTLTAGSSSNADALHTHSAVFSSQVVVSSLTTTGLADGDFGYFSSTNTVSKTDATSINSSRTIGANEGTSGSMTTYGVIESAKFTTAGGSPSVGTAVYLSPSTEEASATGKLTATKPVTAGQVVAEVGIVMDNSNYASLKTCKVLLQVKAPIQL